APAAPVSSAAAGNDFAHMKSIIDRKDNGVRAAALRKELGSAMLENAGIFRDSEKLGLALKAVRDLRDRCQDTFVQDKGRTFNMDLLFAVELDNMLLAETMVVVGIALQESRGSHSRTDFPGRDDEAWLKHTVIYKAPDGPQLEYTPVTITRWQPEERAY
ncbi:MAG: succinate dehydrogenase/fumarate reductase flavoprotein subunit, partial [Chloroflexi bacterium]|nr:succinate dehydrogenase/fumarate reductase flavoprotein subunit [Chloroflexota bacterium]